MALRSGLFDPILEPPLPNYVLILFRGVDINHDVATICFYVDQRTLPGDAPVYNRFRIITCVRCPSSNQLRSRFTLYDRGFFGVLSVHHSGRRVSHGIPDSPNDRASGNRDHWIRPRSIPFPSGLSSGASSAIASHLGAGPYFGRPCQGNLGR